MASSPSTLGVLTMGAWERRLPGTDVPTPVSGLPVGGANQLGSNLSTCLPWNRSKPVPGLGN